VRDDPTTRGNRNRIAETLRVVPTVQLAGKIAEVTFHIERDARRST
jgi:hypothetical protein